MKRTVIFRGKRPDDGRWVYGDLTNELRITVDADVRCLRVCHRDVDENTIGQFTGRHDKDGHPIYENDVLAVGYWRGIVAWDEKSLTWVIKVLNDPVLTLNLSDTDMGKCLVTGNIHEDKEVLTLLKELQDEKD